MALRSRRDSSIIWPGFVDAVTTLLMVMMFVLTIFTVMQVVLRETITTQSNELDSLTDQIAQLADALGLERQRAAGLEAEVGSLTASLTAAQAEGERQAALITTLTGQLATAEGALADAQGRIASFEAQVASLLAERDAARGQVTELTASVEALEEAQQKLISEQEALQLALARAREEVDANAEAARLMAARRAAVEALIASLRTRAEGAEARLSEEEAARLVDAAALEELRARLAGADDELAAMTLALEEQRRRAEETLTLLAAAQTEAARAVEGQSERDAVLAAAERALSEEQAKSLEAQRKVALLNEQIGALRSQLAQLQAVLDDSAARDEAAERALSEEQAKSLEAQRKVALLNEQIGALRSQLAQLQAVLDDSAARDEAAQVQLQSLGTQLNAALAQVAAEQRRRAELEAAEAARLAEENADLARYRSEFFGKLSELLEGREGVRVVGDRFLFSSEVLFQPGAAELAPEGQAQIAGVVEILNEIRGDIPPEIDWIIRVDGHTDNVPLSGLGAFADNWELSQARALSVVRFMQDGLGFPPDRLAATGFGEYRPVTAGSDEQARAQNRRIELKLTER